MRYVAIALLAICLMGCDYLKGKDGRDGVDGKDGSSGASALLSTKIYTGTPNANPYTITCDEITGDNNQIVQIYMVTSAGNKISLPFTWGSNTHEYLINGTAIGFITLGSPSPSTALYDSAWLQCSYRVEIRTFNTASAAIAYKASLSSSPDKSTYGRILYGADK